MKTYTREDGVKCEAVKFEGYEKGGAKGVFDVVSLLNKAQLVALWFPVETTDEWEENEAGDDYIQVVIPEHITTITDRVEVGDYILIRDSQTYVMNAETFEAIYTEVEPVKVATCKHCKRIISNVDEQGVEHKTYIHLEGVQRGLHRCWPADTGKPYGLEAEPTTEVKL